MDTVAPTVAALSLMAHTSIKHNQQQLEQLLTAHTEDHDTGLTMECIIHPVQLRLESTLSAVDEHISISQIFWLKQHL